MPDAMTIADYSYREHQAYQQKLLTAAGVLQAMDICSAGDKFLYNGDTGWQAVPYRGLALLAMVDKKHKENLPFAALLEQIRGQLIACLTDPGALFFLPPDSYHQTIANLLSGERYSTNLEATGMEAQFPGTLQEYLEGGSSTDTAPLTMIMQGLTFFKDAMVLLVDFPEQDYKRISHFRKRVYSSPPLQATGIRRTRPFIGHITIAYAGKRMAGNERLYELMMKLNEKLRFQRPVFYFTAAGLYRYGDLAAFTPMPQVPLFGM